MNPFEMVVLIVLIVVVAISRMAKYRFDVKSNAKPVQDGELKNLRVQIATLDARIQTLEKLITDPSRRLSDEIDALRR